MPSRKCCSALQVKLGPKSQSQSSLGGWVEGSLRAGDDGGIHLGDSITHENLQRSSCCDDDESVETVALGVVRNEGGGFIPVEDELGECVAHVMSK